MADTKGALLDGVKSGLTNEDIAKQLGISPTVAREHITTILGKIGTANRTEAVAVALHKNLLKI